jgi:cell fate regulator YaaT (PSP1 superfamily)
MVNMLEVVGVRFKACGKIYDFEVDGLDLKQGDLVVVESELGLNVGKVVIEKHPVEENDRKIKKVMRKASDEDIEQKEKNKSLEIEAMNNCLERIMARGLPMKLVKTEVTLDRRRIIFYFTAEKRIDFRELVKDLAAKFKTRIEMRQIGVRDEAKIIGSFGICGRELCCSQFLTSFEPISIKMAKKQELVLNTGKLSGICGRLMCCLGYEYTETYQEDAAQSESDELSISEEPEVPETVVASSEPYSKEREQHGVQLRDDSPKPPSSQDKSEGRKKRRKFKRHRRRRKKRPHKK